MLQDGLPQLIGTIYDTVLNPGRWSDVAAGVGRLFDAHRVPIASTTPDRLKPRSIAAFGYGGDDHQGFLDAWHRGNIYGRRPATRSGDVVRASDIVDRRELLRSEIYVSYFAPREIQEAIRIDVLADSASSMAMSICRPFSRGAFDEAELRLARTLTPHLRQAAIIGQRLALAQFISDTALDALHAVGHTVLLLDGSGRIAHASAAGQALLARQDGLAATPNGLEAATAAATRRMTALFERAAGSGQALPVAGAMRLPRPSGLPGLSLLALPIAREHDWLLPRRPATLVYLNDPVAGARPNYGHLGTLYGLTAAEGRLAADLLEGLSLGEIARARGRSLSTVRTHLARLMAKTGTARQSELMRELILTPRLTPMG